MSEDMRGRLHHVEIYVSDLARSKAFWGWLLPYLGYREYQSWDKGISYLLDSTYIVFVQTEERFQNVSYHRCRTGLNHLAFHASSVEEVDKLTELLRARGMTILYEEKHPHAGGPDSYAVFFEDPDRIKVEIVAPFSGR
jgi:catechol 2,3-dioxygenase-like lactoylglutathione lyase family enzyme